MKTIPLTFTLGLLACCLAPLSCHEDSVTNMPVLYPDENRHFIYTNKNSAFYAGNSHQVNTRVWEGWYVDNIRIMRDYELYSASGLISRDSVEGIIFNPGSFIREYSIGLKETFSVLDSVNIIVWEFHSEEKIPDFQFRPLLNMHQGQEIKPLSEKNPQFVFPLQAASENAQPKENYWLGFFYYKPRPDEYLILAIAEKNPDDLRRMSKQLSENYGDYIQDRKERITLFLERNSTFTNIPEVTDAVKWSQISLDALISENHPPGIQTALPGKISIRGRDSFFSLTAAFLVSGQFREAEEILYHFSRYQNLDENDISYGRIPNNLYENPIKYDGADVTWWFIQALYKYILYSGNREFSKKMFPVVKRAIEGALKFRMDKNFYLVHQAHETWMSLSDQTGSFLPRGNRAVEIESLWYAALMTGSKMASWNNEQNLEKQWLEIAENLRKNFLRDFWQPYRYLLYDHLTLENRPDKSFRPNTILAAYAPNAPETAPLLADEIRAHVINAVLTRLTYRYGTGTLWQEDKNFTSVLMDKNNKVRGISLYNGAIWHWLSGPLISGLMDMKIDELGFYLYFHESNQILDEDAIGTFASFREARPQTLEHPLILENNLSSSMSLAGFVSNFYQDFIGYHPDAVEGVIWLSPTLPSELKFVSTILPYAGGRLNFQYSEKGDIFSFEISAEAIDGPVTIMFSFPGFDERTFILDKNKRYFRCNLDKASRTSYSLFSGLDWHMAQWIYSGQR